MIKALIKSTALVAILLAGPLLGSWPVQAAGARLYLAPAAGSVAQNSRFTVQVRLNTGGQQVRHVQANLTYDAARLQFVNISGAGSAFAQSTRAYGGGGEVEIARSAGGPVAGDKLVASITFRARANSGTGRVRFADDSFVLRSSGGQNILSATSGGNYTLKKAAPPRPASPPAPVPAPNYYPYAPAPSGQGSPKPKDTTAPKITAIKLSKVGSKSATISWQTSEPASATVEYGVDGRYDMTAKKAGRRREHRLVLNSDQLLPGTVYNFRIKSTDAAGNTARSPGDTFRTQGMAVQIEVIDESGAVQPGAVVKLGGLSVTADERGLAGFEDIGTGEQAVEVTTSGARVHQTTIMVADTGEDETAEPQTFSVTIPAAAAAEAGAGAGAAAGGWLKTLGLVILGLTVLGGLLFGWWWWRRSSSASAVAANNGSAEYEAELPAASLPEQQLPPVAAGMVAGGTTPPVAAPPPVVPPAAAETGNAGTYQLPLNQAGVYQPPTPGATPGVVQDEAANSPDIWEQYELSQPNPTPPADSYQFPPANLPPAEPPLPAADVHANDPTGTDQHAQIYEGQPVSLHNQN